jgi:peptidoglycan/xylan/chitin deacetylase (PgdA/CDA1 family)
MWGFLYRATVGATRDLVRRKLSFTRWIASLKAAASLPLVHLGWLNDFWMLFEWYLQVEKNLSPTYFFIPFKHQAGDKVSAAHPERRASAYDITEIPEWIRRLKAEGCEIGVHGIDAWHSAAKGRDELKRVAEAAGRRDLGIRMHWLLRDENTYRVLEEAGYAYDSTAGYNETPGYRCGTTQAFRPLTARKLLELPMHIQDGALFYPGRLGLSEPAAWSLCETFIDNARQRGGVLTVLWHDRSPGPERFWGDFYVRLVEKLKSLDAWFGTAGQVVDWFRQRRAVTFERVEAEDGSCRIKLCGTGRRTTPALKVRIHSATRAAEDFVWDGETDLEPAVLAGTANPARREPLSVGVPK